MRTQASFQQILEDKIKARHQQSLEPSGFEQQPTSVDPAHLAYLMGQMGSTFFRPQTQKIYPARPKPPPPPPKPHDLNLAQIRARDFFLVHGVELSPAFALKDLKKAFRTLALRLHPDMNKGASGAFIELKTHYEELLHLFSSSSL